MKKMSLNNMILIAATLAAFSAQAHTSSNTLQKAMQVINHIDYLPFSVKKDGCYARSFYMSMELLTHGIPASQHYIFGQLHPEPGVTWRYHVAPMINIDGSAQHAIFDPSLNNKPLTPAYWAKLSNPADEPLTYVAPASHYTKSQVQERANAGKFGYSQQNKVLSIKSTPKYKISEIARACQTAWYYIGVEQASADYKAAKRLKLEDRTNELIEKLIKMKKLDSGSSLESCAHGKYSE